MADDSELPAEVVKVGNLTNDLAMVYTEAGMPVAKGGLAWTPYNAETKERGETVFYDLSLFADLAEHAAECLTKGMRVIVVGKPELYTPEPTKERPEPVVRRAIMVRAIGPDLRWQTCQVTKIQRSASTVSKTNSPPDDEPF